MRKTFEELLEKEYYYINDGLAKVVDSEDCIELMKIVRIHTLEEVANKAEAGYDHYKDEFDSDVIECYVFKQSILSLDKNSIEI